MIAAPTVNVYIADVSPLAEEALFELLLSRVSEERRAKVLRLRFRRDQYLSLGAECLLMRACRDAGIDYGEAHIVSGPHGKPDFADLPLHFSLSHSGTRAMCVLSPLPVGCDTEAVRSADLRIAKKFFHAREQALLEACPAVEREELFTRLWTRKESFVKCTGDGFSLPMNRFSACPGGEARDVLPGGRPDAGASGGAEAYEAFDCMRTPEGALFRFLEINPGDAYRCTVCARLPEGLAPGDIRLQVHFLALPEREYR